MRDPRGTRNTPKNGAQCVRGWKHCSSRRRTGREECGWNRVFCQQEVVPANYFLSVLLVTSRCAFFWLNFNKTLKAVQVYDPAIASDDDEVDEF